MRNPEGQENRFIERILCVSSRKDDTFPMVRSKGPTPTLFVHSSMPSNAVASKKKHSKALQSELLDIYSALLTPRLIEEKMLNLLRQNKISKWFSGIGQEAVSVGVGLVADREDPIFTMHRNLGVFTTRKVPYYPLFCQLFGKADGFTGGRERSFHFGIPEWNIYGMISHLAATMPIADGVALAHKHSKSGKVVFSFCGDGATSEGDFHEALNLAAVWSLPIVFIIENNGYALSTPNTQQFVCQNLVDKAIGYGMEGIMVDGNDVLAVTEAVRKARALAIKGRPVLLEAKTFRMRGHEEASGTAYVPKELLKKWALLDPIKRLEEELIRSGTADRKQLDGFKSIIKETFEADLKKALEAPKPVFDPIRELADAGLLTTPPSDDEGNGIPPMMTSDASSVIGAASPSTAKDSIQPKEMRFVDAIQNGLRHAMREIPSSVILGQDIADYGGVFKVTEGFLEEFGPERVRNTPIIESGAIGAAIGLAISGQPSVVEMQFADFISCGFNQIINNLSKGRYRWMPPMNVTIRSPHGAGVGAGPFHSQSPEGWFMQHPGMRILVPSTVQDAQDMTYSALLDPNPVLIFEHKKLYRSLKEEIDPRPRRIELGRALVRREGRDASIITYGYGLLWAQEMASEWESKGVSLEILDLRSLSPIDWDSVSRTVRKTGRVLLLQEAPETLGPLSEVAAWIQENTFEWLDAPVLRCSSLDMPIPFSTQLEEGYLPSARMRAAMERLLAY